MIIPTNLHKAVHATLHVNPDRVRQRARSAQIRSDIVTRDCRGVAGAQTDANAVSADHVPCCNRSSADGRARRDEYSYSICGGGLARWLQADEIAFNHISIVWVEQRNRGVAAGNRQATNMGEASHPKPVSARHSASIHLNENDCVIAQRERVRVSTGLGIAVDENVFDVGQRIRAHINDMDARAGNVKGNRASTRIGARLIDCRRERTRPGAGFSRDRELSGDSGRSEQRGNQNRQEKDAQ